MPKLAARPPADNEADTAVGALITARQAERLSLLAASAQTGAMFAAETDPDRKRQFAGQVAQFDRDLASIEAAITELAKIGGKANSGQKLAKAHDDNVAAAAAWTAANPIAKPEGPTP